MASYFDIRGFATKIFAATIATLTVGTLLVIASGVKIAGNLIPSSNDTYTVGTTTGPFLWKEGYFSDVLQVNGQDVCLEDGTNCLAVGGGSDSNWTLNASSGFLRPVTTTNDLVLGATASATAPFYFDVASPTSSLQIGRANNANFFVGTSTYGGGLDAAFSLNGDDAFIQSNLGVLGIGYFGTVTGTIGNFNSATIGALTLQSGTTSWLGFTTASGTTLNASAIAVNGSSVCLANGTNCPLTAESDTLATVSARGSSATTTLQFYGGFLAASSTVTSTFTVLGDTSLQNFTFANGTGTNVTTTKLYSSRIDSSDFRSSVTTTFTNSAPFLGGGETAFVYSAPNMGGTDFYSKYSGGFGNLWLGSYGQVLADKGTQTRPSYTFNNATVSTTGMYSPAARDIGFSIDGLLVFDLFQQSAAHTTTTYNFTEDGAKTCFKMAAMDGTLYYIRLSSTGGFVTSTASCS